VCLCMAGSMYQPARVERLIEFWLPAGAAAVAATLRLCCVPRAEPVAERSAWAGPVGPQGEAERRTCCGRPGWWHGGNGLRRGVRRTAFDAPATRLRLGVAGRACTWRPTSCVARAGSNPDGNANGTLRSLGRGWKTMVNGSYIDRRAWCAGRRNLSGRGQVCSLTRDTDTGAEGLCGRVSDCDSGRCWRISQAGAKAAWTDLERSNLAA